MSSAAIHSKNVHGEFGFAQNVSIQNSHQIGVAGQFFETSGYSISGALVELNAGVNERQSVMVINQSSGILYIGKSGIGIQNMMPISGIGTSVSFSITSGIRIFGITEEYTADVRVVEIG